MRRASRDTALEIDPGELARPDRYKLLCGLVVPRPIALVTTLSESGVVNAAPFSFFNVFSEAPPVVCLGLNARPDGGLKDTTRNIERSGEYVVHVATEGIAEAMNLCSVDFPAEMSEVEIAGFTTEPSRVVRPPRIAEAPVALECRLMSIIALSEVRNLVLGEIVHIRTRPGIVDPERLYVDIARYRPLARLFGNFYAGLADVFTLTRRTYGEWRAARSREEA